MQRIKYTDRKETLRLFQEFMLQNKPCIFEDLFTKDWDARKVWSNDNETLNIDYLKTLYGNLECPVIIDERTSECVEMSFADYVKEYILRGKYGYLKDWHFQSLRHKNGLNKVYKLFSILNFDWINNERWTTSSDDNPFGEDYRFLYLGTKGTWTKFHCDVMGSYSWSANIIGRKIWYFIPIGNEKFFIDNYSGNTYVNDIRERISLWNEAGVFEIVQNPGEVIFVPSGMWHQVHNEELTLSLNHNFINSANIEIIYDLLKKRRIDVKKEIDDVISMNIYSNDDINKIIENLLKLDIKINFEMLYQLLEKVKNDREVFVKTFDANNIDSPLVNIKEITKENIDKISEGHCKCNEDICQNCFYLMMKLDLIVVNKLLFDFQRDDF